MAAVFLRFLYDSQIPSQYPTELLAGQGFAFDDSQAAQLTQTNEYPPPEEFCLQSLANRE
jgi:hypothetical protein